jgi:hypothetical protein
MATPATAARGHISGRAYPYRGNSHQSQNSLTQHGPVLVLVAPYAHQLISREIVALMEKEKGAGRCVTPFEES